LRKVPWARVEDSLERDSLTAPERVPEVVADAIYRPKAELVLLALGWLGVANICFDKSVSIVTYFARY
jgi:hypothetical protein